MQQQQQQQHPLYHHHHHHYQPIHHHSHKRPLDSIEDELVPPSPPSSHSSDVEGLGFHPSTFSSSASSAQLNTNKRQKTSLEPAFEKLSLSYSAPPLIPFNSSPTTTSSPLAASQGEQGRIDVTDDVVDGSSSGIVRGLQIPVLGVTEPTPEIGIGDLERMERMDDDEDEDEEEGAGHSIPVVNGTRDPNTVYVTSLDTDSDEDSIEPAPTPAISIPSRLLANDLLSPLPASLLSAAPTLLQKNWGELVLYRPIVIPPPFQSLSKEDKEQELEEFRRERSRVEAEEDAVLPADDEGEEEDEDGMEVDDG